MSTHPSETDLALLAGGDCGRWQRFFLNRHVARCGDCRDTLASFTELRSETLELSSNNAGVMPETDWNRLAGEIRANIRLGLAAGECVGEAPTAILPVSWKPRLAIAAVCVLLLAGAGIFPPPVSAERQSSGRGARGNGGIQFHGSPGHNRFQQYDADEPRRRGGRSDGGSGRLHSR